MGGYRLRRKRKDGGYDHRYHDHWPWNKVDWLLMCAVMAPSKQHKLDMFVRISKTWGLSQDQLDRRIEKLQFKYVAIQDGPAAIDDWEQRTLAIARLLAMRQQLVEGRIQKKALRMKSAWHKLHNRSVSLREVANMFRVTQQNIKWMVDLELLKQDQNGRYALRDVRDFWDRVGWWLFRAVRFIEKERLDQRLQKLQQSGSQSPPSTQ